MRYFFICIDQKWMEHCKHYNFLVIHCWVVMCFSWCWELSDSFRHFDLFVIFILILKWINPNTKYMISWTIRNNSSVFLLLFLVWVDKTKTRDHNSTVCVRILTFHFVSFLFINNWILFFFFHFLLRHSFEINLEINSNSFCSSILWNKSKYNFTGQVKNLAKNHSNF